MDNLNKKEFKRWLEALYEQEFSQTRGVLQDKRGYCCLGVGCELLIQKDLKELDDRNFIEGAYPVSQQHAPNWLKNINDDFGDITGSELAHLNDGGQKDYRNKLLGKFTHPEIAMLLDLVYNHNMLRGFSKDDL